MQIHTSGQHLSIKNPVVTVGIFDGVHTGHKKILSRLKERAEELHGQTVVLTLDPHPQKIFRPNAHPALLSSIQEKAELLEEFGINHLIVYPFNRKFSSLTACEFIEKILTKELGTKHLVVGYDHRFGSDKETDIQKLKSCGLQFGFDTERVEALSMENETISSTKIRHALLDGNISKATKYLGYDYSISGTIVPGDQIGRTIGFPTANLKVDFEDKLIPAPGVYAVEVENSDFGKRLGMLNIGHRPTIQSHNNQTIEVHIFDYSGDLYNQKLKLYFKAFLRSEIKFESISKLQTQLEIDKKQSLEILQNSEPNL